MTFICLCYRQSCIEGAQETEHTCIRCNAVRLGPSCQTLLGTIKYFPSNTVERSGSVLRFHFSNRLSCVLSGRTVMAVVALTTVPVEFLLGRLKGGGRCAYRTGSAFTVSSSELSPSSVRARFCRPSTHSLCWDAETRDVVVI